MKYCRKYLFTALFLLFVGCGNDENPVQPDPDPPAPSPAEPVNISPPEALFTEPDQIVDGKQSTIILDRLIELVDAVPKEASIYISIYQFEYQPLVDALERAHSRDVKLHVMLDMSGRSDNTRVANQLSVFGGNIEIVRIHNNASGSAINHNKFVLLPEVTTSKGTLEHVIFQTSQNLTESGNRKIQDAVILSDENLYQAYFDYWDDMKSLAADGMENFEYREYNDPSKGITAYFHPKRKDGTAYGNDTIVEILDDIDEPSSTSVKIGMSAWTDSRIAIVEKLEELQLEGAEIEVITKNSIGSETYDRLKDLEENGAYVTIYNMTNSDHQKINIHSKFMMIEGAWNGTETKVLLTGTQNFTINALRNNNEATFLFEDHTFYDQYEAYYDKLKNLPGICCPAKYSYKVIHS